jgi:uncharacterized protein (TIGR03435 family)
MNHSSAYGVYQRTTLIFLCPNEANMDGYSGFCRTAAATVLIMTGIAGQFLAGTSQANLQFGAVSIKPFSRSGQGYYGCHGIDNSGRMFGPRGELIIVVPQGRCSGRGVNPRYLIADAYGVDPRQVSGEPDWMRGNDPSSNVYDIDAVSQNPSTATIGQLRQMLQTMLADRFKLTIHREMQESAGYALVVAKNGTKLKESSGDEKPPFDTRNEKGQPVIKGVSPFDQLASSLRRLVDGPVVDRTGLSGSYDYEFVVPGLPAQGGARGGARGAGGPDASDISDGLQDQMGLRLQREKVQLDVIVIDHIERPSPN